MYKETSTFSVAILGFSENDQQVLKSILWLSKSRSICYRVNKDNSTEDGVDVAILNVDNGDAITAWRSRPTNNPMLKTVLATNETLDEPQTPLIKRPFIASKVLDALDQATQPLQTETTTAAATPAGHNPKAEIQPLRALVVDDSLVVRKQMELELQQLGIQVYLAESASKATTYLNRSAYDIIFLDVILPDGDGLNICKTIKKDQNHINTPVFLLTGKVSPFDRLKGKVAGCDVYLTKPLKIQTLRKAIKNYLPTNGVKSTPEDALAL